MRDVMEEVPCTQHPPTICLPCVHTSPGSSLQSLSVLCSDSHGVLTPVVLPPPPPHHAPVQARSCADPWARLYARLTLAGLPRGGGNGDNIRMGILHIMRDGGIKEGHRPVRSLRV
jgi:hypothetical protein